MAQIRHFKCNTHNIPAGVWLLIHLLKLTEMRLMKLQEHVKDMIGKNNPVIIQPSANQLSYLWSQHPFWYIRYFPVYCTYTHNMCLPVLRTLLTVLCFWRLYGTPTPGKHQAKTVYRVSKWPNGLRLSPDKDMTGWISESFHHQPCVFFEVWSWTKFIHLIHCKRVWRSASHKNNF